MFGVLLYGFDLNSAPKLFDISLSLRSFSLTPIFSTSFLSGRAGGILMGLIFLMELCTYKTYEVSLVKKALLDKEEYIKKMMPTSPPNVGE